MLYDRGEVMGNMASTLRYGARGDEVKELQKRLNSAGYGLSVDGIFGDKTLGAVKKYQQSNGLAVDGIVGANTWGKLTGSGSSKKPASTTATGTTAAPAPTATSPMGTTYNPQETTANKADLGKIEGSAPAFQQTQEYKDAAAALKDWQGSKPTYQSSFGDRLNQIYEQVMGTGKYESPYAGQIAGLQQQIADMGSYESPYADRISQLYDQIMERPDFSYDFNADPLYQQYKDSYMHSANRAMRDTMANAAALTGGYGSSYAATAGQQAYNEQMAGLNDALPALYEAAYGRYTDEGNALMNRLNMAQGLDESAYARYGDELNRLLAQLQTAQGLDETEYARYQNELNRLLTQMETTQGMEEAEYGRYQDALGDYYKQGGLLTDAAESQYGKDYQAYQDALSKYLTDREYYYGKTQDELAQQNYENELAAAKKGSGGSSGSGKSSTTKSGGSAGSSTESPLPAAGDTILLREYSDALNAIAEMTRDPGAVGQAASDLKATYKINAADAKLEAALNHAVGLADEAAKKKSNTLAGKITSAIK